MKLSQIQFELSWPKSIQLINLRSFILDKLHQKGDVIRWSISQIKISEEEMSRKKLTINAVIVN